MKTKSLLFATISLFSAVSTGLAGDKQLFNGTDLSGWDGITELWSVEDGAITGQTKADTEMSGNTFLVWNGGEPGDFILTFQFKMTPGDDQKYTNSGVQYRSKVLDTTNWVVGGYQADFEYGETYSGILYEEKGRGILAKRGEKVTIKQGEDANKPIIEVTGETGKSEDIQAAIKRDGWNEYKIVADGTHVQHFINGKLTVDVTDETAEAPKTGVIALQLHKGPPMKVQFKDIVLNEKG